MTKKLSHIERQRQELDRVRYRIQQILRLNDDEYCQLQYDFYEPYLEVMFPSSFPEGERMRDQMRNSPVYRRWFVLNWNKKDLEFLSRLDFNCHPSVLCSYTRDVETDAGVFESKLYIANRQALYSYYSLMHQQIGKYEAIPERILKAVFN